MSKEIVVENVVAAPGIADEEILYPNQDKSSEEIVADKEKENQEKTDAEKKVIEDKKAEEDKKVEDAADAGLVVAENLKFPEGVPVDEGIMAEFIGVSNNKDMSPVQKAQALIDLQVKLNTQAYQQRMDTWISQVKADPKFLGPTGDKLEENLALAKKGMESLNIKGLPEYLVSSGEGNNPFFVEVFMKLGEIVSEDTFRFTEGHVGRKERKSDAEVLYGATKL